MLVPRKQPSSSPVAGEKQASCRVAGESHACNNNNNNNNNTWRLNYLHDDIFYLFWINMNSHACHPTTTHGRRSRHTVSRPRAAAPPVLALRAASGYAFSHSPYPIIDY